ncbi:MAG: hypothetical protein NZM04_09410 [Methylacidiphilales bacterium]|nr:hypothetical protein [Candidatus Methylacidiphilales bacterium]
MTNYSLADLPYLMQFIEIPPDIYRHIESSFNLYPKETSLLLRYFSFDHYMDVVILATKFLVDKRIVKDIFELDFVRTILGHAAHGFFLKYLLYMSGNIKALEEIEEYLNSLKTLDGLNFLRIMTMGSDDRIIEIIKKCLIKKSKNIAYIPYICDYFANIFYSTFRDKIIDGILNKSELYSYRMHMIKSLSTSNNPVCVKDLIYIYKETDDIKMKRAIIECMQNCLLHEAVDFLLDTIYNNKNTSLDLAFDALVQIYNKLTYDEYMNKDCIDKAERERIINTIRQNKDKLKYVAMDALDKNKDCRMILASFNLLFSICGIEKDTSILDKNKSIGLDLYDNKLKIFKIITNKIFKKENVLFMLEYIKTGDAQMIIEIYKEFPVIEYLRDKLRVFFDENIDKLFSKMLDVIFINNMDCLLPYIPYILEHKNIEITTELRALRIASLVHKKEFIEFLESYITENYINNKREYLLLLLYELNKTKGVEVAKNIIHKISMSEGYEFIDQPSLFIILSTQNDPSSLASIFDFMSKEKKDMYYKIIRLFKYLDKENILKSLSVVYNNNQNSSKILEILNKCHMPIKDATQIDIDHLVLNSE